MAVCVALMASMRLCASSTSTTFPLSGMRIDSRVDLCSSVA